MRKFEVTMKRRQKWHNGKELIPVLIDVWDAETEAEARNNAKHGNNMQLYEIKSCREIKQDIAA